MKPVTVTEIPGVVEQPEALDPGRRRFRHHRLMRSEIRGSLDALSSVVRDAARG